MVKVRAPLEYQLTFLPLAACSPLPVFSFHWVCRVCWIHWLAAA